ncbi:unnamed protein product [Agarophyton chilense]
MSSVRHSALLASPGLLSAHALLTLDSVSPCHEDASQAASARDTQRRISFGAVTDQLIHRNDSQLRSHSPCPKKRTPSISVRNRGPTSDALPEPHPQLSQEPTQNRIIPEESQRKVSSESDQWHVLPEPSQQPSPEAPHQLSDSCSPLFPPSQRALLTAKHSPSQPTPPTSHRPSPDQPLQFSRTPTPSAKSPLCSKMRFRRFATSLSMGNSACSWAGELGSPSSAALSIFRKPEHRLIEQPLQLRGISPPRCKPRAPSPTISEPSPVQQPKQTPEQLKRDPIPTQDTEELALQSGTEKAGDIEHTVEDVLSEENRVKEMTNSTDEVHHDTQVDIRMRSMCNNEIMDVCSSTQSPCSAGLKEKNKTEGENTKAQDDAVYCRSVLVSIPSGVLRSVDYNESPQ